MALFFLAVILIILVTFVYGALSAAPWVPMRLGDRARVLEIIKKLSRGKNIYELGSGDGRMLAVVDAAGFKAIGFEISLLPFLIGSVRKIFVRGRYQMNYKSFWPVSLAEADVVFFFLLPKIMPKVRAKLERELRPGALIVSYVFSIPGWTPILIDEAHASPKIFVYERP